MLRARRHGGPLVCFLLSAFAALGAEAGFTRCSCDSGDALWSAEGILQCQKAGDFLIAAAYFSIPLELLYFVTCSSLFPFKWVLFQFGAFIVLCGLTHLLTLFTYEPHPFLLMLALTVSKFLTALVSFATAITLLTLIPQLLRVKVRENFLRIKARDLDREVGLMKRQEEASWHVRMLTQEIRKSLDRHTILYTTLVELSNTLGLHNCAVWMPEEERGEMSLTHELRRRSASGLSIPLDDLDVVEISGSKGVKILKSDSALACVSGGGGDEPGAVAAIRMPMLKASNFKGGTPEMMRTSYAILVLVLPRDGTRSWSCHELEIVGVVADQVAVALSHASVLEESQAMRDKLAEQNRALVWAKQNMVMASEARNSFQRTINQGMRKPIHSILGLLSMMQQENLGPEQRLIINTMAKSGMVVSTLINDAMDASTINSESLSFKIRSFELHLMIKEAASAARCLCDSRGFGFGIQVENAVPNLVIGDEKRIFHVLLHMVGIIIDGCDEGFVMFRILSVDDTDDGQDQKWAPWRVNSSTAYGSIKFELGIKGSGTRDSNSAVQLSRRPNSEELEMGHGFSMCRKLVQMMHGNIWLVPNSEGLLESMVLVLKFQLQSFETTSEPGGSSERYHTPPTPHFKGIRVLLAEDDSISRAVIRKLLEKLGFRVSSVSSGIECISSLGISGTPFQLIILDLHMTTMDGFEVATRIRNLRSGCWPLIVGLTVSAKEDVWERCGRSGINGLIQKPVVFQALSDELRRVLQNT